MIAAESIRYLKFPGSEEKQIRVEGLSVTLQIKKKHKKYYLKILSF